jgi:hypothetical protein
MERYSYMALEASLVETFERATAVVFSLILFSIVVRKNIMQFAI